MQPAKDATLARQTERVREVYHAEAADYDARFDRMEGWLLGDGRARLVANATGDVLEVAVGTGRNLPYYPPAVRLTGIELSPEMLEQARIRAASLDFSPRPDLRLGDATALPFAAGSFDTVVITLALCTIPDPAAAVCEAWRVLRPAGRLLLLEHVGSRVWPVRGLQALMDGHSVKHHADHLLREPRDYLAPAGFVVEQDKRSRLGVVARIVARKAGPS